MHCGDGEQKNFSLPRLSWCTMCVKPLLSKIFIRKGKCPRVLNRFSKVGRSMSEPSRSLGTGGENLT